MSDKRIACKFGYGNYSGSRIQLVYPESVNSGSFSLKGNSESLFPCSVSAMQRDWESSSLCTDPTG